MLSLPMPVHAHARNFKVVFFKSISIQNFVIFYMASFIPNFNQIPQNLNHSSFLYLYTIYILIFFIISLKDHILMLSYRWKLSRGLFALKWPLSAEFPPFHISIGENFLTRKLLVQLVQYIQLTARSVTFLLDNYLDQQLINQLMNFISLHMNMSMLPSLSENVSSTQIQKMRHEFFWSRS